VSQEQSRCMLQMPSGESRTLLDRVPV